MPEHKYLTAVVDSLDWLDRLIIDQTCKDINAPSLQEKKFYGKGYNFTLPRWREFFDGLDALANQRGMTVILIAHYNAEKVRHPSLDTYTCYGPKLPAPASEMVREWCSEILFATYKTHTVTKDEGFGRERAVAIGGTERVLYTTATATHLAGNRLGLPDELPLDWREFAKYLPTPADGRRARPRRILLYGTGKIGKSTWASMAPRPKFIPTEPGLNDINCDAFYVDDRPAKPICQDFGEVMQCIESLYRETTPVAA